MQLPEGVTAVHQKLSKLQCTHDFHTADLKAGGGISEDEEELWESDEGEEGQDGEDGEEDGEEEEERAEGGEGSDSDVSLNAGDLGSDEEEVRGGGAEEEEEEEEEAGWDSLELNPTPVTGLEGQEEGEEGDRRLLGKHAMGRKKVTAL